MTEIRVEKTRRALARVLRHFGRRVIIAFAAIPIGTIASVDMLGVNFPQPGDSDNFSGHATAWIAVAIILAVGLMGRIWLRHPTRETPLTVVRLLLVLSAGAIALDAICDVIVADFLLQRRIGNAFAAPAFFALPTSILAVVAGVIMSRVKLRES